MESKTGQISDHAALADSKKLGRLSDPFSFTEMLDITGASTDLLLKQLRDMLRIRFAEEKIGDMVTAKKIVCPCHLAIGQEGIAVGVSAHLRKTDRAFGTHRSHSHFLAMGGSTFELFAEILGKAAGCSKGLGGSMHLWGEPFGFKGSVPIVGGTVSLAVGAAFAAKLDQQANSDVGVAFFGDGAAEEGSVHECLNLAAHFKLPMLFVCENNLFSSHLHINLRQPSDLVSRYAVAHHINTEVVDGNDVVAVARATERLLEKARKGEGPGYLEAVTYRWRGHVGPREDDDVGLKRKEDLVQWKKRDPVRRLKDALITKSYFNEEKFRALEIELRAQMETDWQRAEASPFPPTSELLDLVYSPHPHKSGMKYSQRN